jgi:hypothetical protein
LRGNRFFKPGPLTLRESVHKGRKARLMIFTIKPCFVPSLKRIFHGEVEEAARRVNLESHAPITFSYWHLVGILGKIILE